MWFKQSSIEVVQGADSVTRACENCHNETAHVLVDQPYGLQFGIPFMKRPLLSSHVGYFLACPVCGTLNLRLTKDQAHGLMRR
jgi:hypothetical protein